MIFSKKVVEPSNTEKEYERVLLHASTLDPSSPEYAKVVPILDALNKLLPPKPEKNRVKADTWANLSAYLLQTGMVMKQEQFNVITSKMFGAKPPKL